MVVGEAVMRTSRKALRGDFFLLEWSSSTEVMWSNTAM